MAYQRCISCQLKIQLNSYLKLWFLVIPQLFYCLSSTSQTQQVLSKKEQQSLKLIRELEHFGRKTLKLKLHHHFYTKWQEPELQNTYLYLSRPDSIVLPEKANAFEFFGTDTSAARIKADSCTLAGLDALIYRTSGTSAVKLTHHLLNYPPEAIVFVVLHEMAHVHQNEKKTNIPYSAEESFGDFLGNVAGEYFVQQYHPEWLKAFQHQRLIHEQLYALFYKTEMRVQGISKDRKILIYAQAQVQLNALMELANSFQNDRFNYSMNNAYILRNRFYYRWYNNFLSAAQRGDTWKQLRQRYDTFSEL